MIKMNALVPYLGYHEISSRKISLFVIDLSVDPYHLGLLTNFHVKHLINDIRFITL